MINVLTFDLHSDRQLMFALKVSAFSALKSVILSSSFLHFPTASPTLGLFIFDNMRIGDMQDAPNPQEESAIYKDPWAIRLPCLLILWD